MTRYLGVLVIAALIHSSIQISTPESDSYVAAVVEIARYGQAEALNEYADYANFILHPDAADVDIIVFPAVTHFFFSMTVPDPVDMIIPCGNTSFDRHSLQSVSCAAQTASKYVVVNVPLHHSERLYSANVVFDRNGAIVSVYRANNVYRQSAGDLGSLLAVGTDESTFRTDFGVEFGHLFGFDILSVEPATNLLSRGITDFILPFEWVSETPFLTAVQIQQGWAHTHNVNLLAAGRNNPTFGHTGSGIFSGTQGPLRSIFTSTSGNRMLVHRISKTPGNNPVFEPESVPIATPAIPIRNENLSEYIQSGVSPQLSTGRTCLGPFCCSFSMFVRSYNLDENERTYRYATMQRRGRRTFDGFGDGNFRTCAVVACTDVNDRSTCGTIFSPDPTKTLVNGEQLVSLSVGGTFLAKEAVTMPSTIGNNMIPLNTTHYNYIESEHYDIDGVSYKNVSITLVTSGHHFLTFGIYSKEFNTATSPVVSLILIFGVLINVFKNM